MNSLLSHDKAILTIFIRYKIIQNNQPVQQRYGGIRLKRRYGGFHVEIRVQT